MRDNATRTAQESWIAEYGGDADVAEWSAWDLETMWMEARWETEDALAEYRAPLLVAGAGAGTIAGPAAAAAWLTRRDLELPRERWQGPSPHLATVVRVPATRPPEWQADVAARLTTKIGGCLARVGEQPCLRSVHPTGNDDGVPVRFPFAHGRKVSAGLTGRWRKPFAASQRG
ncbi:hypothetical protein AB0B45_10945 [Nonomuraea sp. NPDC049152]|uniref:hypothetical protein n=1 Tax=Nonomuraea sp. NPDC049152 TaxID=3154350 RepID=UPI0033D71BD0